jgi:hypothetical protein
MPLRKLFSGNAVSSVLAMLVVITIVAGGDRETSVVFAAATGGSSEQGGSCPLTSEQEIKSIQAWNKMIPVFRHPRCQNCHGGIPDPRDGPFPANHFGVVEIQEGEGEKTCQECHMDGWFMPGKPLFWTDKSDIELCSMQKAQFKSSGGGPGFIDHIVKDGGHGFIETAFKGMRGLTDGGLTIVEDDRRVTAEPAPGSHARLIQMARDWVAAQGGNFVGDEDCGCTLDKMEVKFSSTLAIDNLGPSKESTTITAQASLFLKLAPDMGEPTWDVTTGPDGKSGTLSFSGVTVKRAGTCTFNVTASPPAKIGAWLAVSYKPDLKFALAMVPETSELHDVLQKCTVPVTGQVITVAIKIPHIFAAGWTSLHGGPGAMPMAGLTMPAPGATPTAPAGGLDMTKIMSMDPKALEAMAEKMKSNPTPAGMADLGKLMNQVLPGADQMAAAARENFRFKIPDAARCRLQPGTASLASCTINQTITVPDNKGATQRITEKTTITIGRPAQ